jgi:hypothetical protein
MKSKLQRLIENKSFKDIKALFSELAKLKLNPKRLGKNCDNKNSWLIALA